MTFRTYGLVEAGVGSIGGPDVVDERIGNQAAQEGQADAIAHAAHRANARIRSLRISDAWKSAAEILVHEASEAFGEVALEPHALSQYGANERRDLVALVAAMHLAVYGPLSVETEAALRRPRSSGDKVYKE
jgi:hypothetical protein